MYFFQLLDLVSGTTKTAQLLPALSFQESCSLPAFPSLTHSPRVSGAQKSPYRPHVALCLFLLLASSILFEIISPTPLRFLSFANFLMVCPAALSRPLRENIKQYRIQYQLLLAHTLSAWSQIGVRDSCQNPWSLLLQPVLSCLSFHSCGSHFINSCVRTSGDQDVSLL